MASAATNHCLCPDTDGAQYSSDSLFKKGEEEEAGTAGEGKEQKHEDREGKEEEEEEERQRSNGIIIMIEIASRGGNNYSI